MFLNAVSGSASAGRFISFKVNIQNSDKKIN